MNYLSCSQLIQKNQISFENRFLSKLGKFVYIVAKTHGIESVDIAYDPDHPEWKVHTYEQRHESALLVMIHFFIKHNRPGKAFNMSLVCQISDEINQKSRAI